MKRVRLFLAVASKVAGCRPSGESKFLRIGAMGAMMVAVMLVFGSKPTFAANKTFSGTGNFSDATKWSGGTLPGAGDNLTITGTCTFDNSANNLAYGSLQVGTNSLAGTLQWPVGGTNTLDVSGISASGSKGGTIDMTNGGTLKIGNSDWITTGQTFTPGTGTIHWNDTGNGGTLPAAITTYNNLIIDVSTKTASLGVATTVNGNLTISTGTLDVTTGNLALNVKGNWTNNASFNQRSGTVTFNGSSAQTIGGSTATVFSTLTLNNSSGLTLNVNATASSALNLTNGDITTGSNTLFQGTGSTSSGNGDVVGKVNRTDLNGGTARSFGNPNVQITETAGTVTSFDVTLVKGSTANNFTNSVKRVYTLTPNGGISLVATVRLHYLDAELNGNSESTLQLWRESGTTWSAQGGTVTDDMVGDNNYVQLAGVLSFSPWAISGPSAPTDVAMIEMKATRYDERVLLEWQTGYEVSNVGFNIYREKDGNLTKVTPEPVAGSALMFGPRIALRAGFAYSWWDDSAEGENTSRYWIEDLDLSGRTTIHGPFGVDQPPPGDRLPPPGKEKVSLLSALGKDAAVEGSTVPVETKAKVVKLTAARLFVQSGIASLPAAKLSVQQAGWYRVEQSDLVAAGFSANGDPRKLQLIVDGQQVPIDVTGKGNSWDGVEFYGVGIDSPFTAKHIYWLIAGSQPGLRISQASGKGGTPAPSTFPYTVERRDKLVYFPALKNGGREKFFGPLIYNAQPVDQSLTLQHVALASANATLVVSLQGFTDAPHSVNVVFNGSQIGTIQFSGLAKGTATYSVPQGSLLEGSNQLQLIGPTGFSDISMVEYVRLTYLHTNTADGDSLQFPAVGGQQATIGGFTNSAIRVMDVSTPNSPQELGATVKQVVKGTYSVTATVPGTGARTLLAFASNQRKKPAALTLNQPSNWRDPSQAADYVAITRKDLLSSLGPLKTQRQSQGLSVALVDVEDVYDEFSFGNKTPQALKDFLSYATSSWVKKPRFALLGGDATYDPKNYLGVGDFDIVPTKLVETTFNETATDDWFVDFNNDGVPDMAVGRLPVRTAQEMSALVSKIVGYDQSTATKNVLLVADTNQGFDFEGADAQLQSLIPATLTVTDIRRGQVGDSTARSELLNGINQGQKLVNYYGHGSTRVWADAPLLTAADAPGFTNTGGLALFDAMTCLSGFFHDPSIESLGEAVLKAQGGAIAVWASSGMTDPSAQVQMNQEAFRQLFSGAGLTIGEVTARAKAATGNTDVRRTWILLGDPATKLK